MDAWNTFSFPFGFRPIFRCLSCVSFQGVSKRRTGSLKVPQSSLGILRVSQLPPPLEYPPLKNPTIKPQDRCQHCKPWLLDSSQDRPAGRGATFAWKIVGPEGNFDGWPVFEGSFWVPVFVFFKQSGEINNPPNWIPRWWFQRSFIFTPYLGKIPILTNIFQMGWNHQLDTYSDHLLRYWNDIASCWVYL